MIMIPGSKGHADSSCLHVRGCMHLYNPPKHEKVAIFLQKNERILNVLRISRARRAEKSGIVGGKIPFDPNIMIIILTTVGFQ